jgi:predicted mannosyl-3-phosphoglycerate phosphatase (HAD superfamily)
LRSSTTVVFCAIDDLIPVSGNPLTGFPEFLDSLSEAHIPCVWITSRNRLQLDSTLRKLGHSEPFIAEGGSAAYIFEDYFHLKPSHTIRLGRFTCIPIATRQPAAAEALALVAEQTGVTVVPLRSLSPRELVQNTGLSRHDAEAMRQRDFDELFFFAGASDADILRFQRKAIHLKLAVRPYGSLWSLAVNSSLAACIRELRKLFDRTFRTHAFSIALATAKNSSELFPACDRGILLTDRGSDPGPPGPPGRPAPKSLPLFQGETWSLALEAIQTRSF